MLFVDASELIERDPDPELLRVLLCPHPNRPEPLLAQDVFGDKLLLDILGNGTPAPLATFLSEAVAVPVEANNVGPDRGHGDSGRLGHFSKRTLDFVKTIDGPVSPLEQAENLVRPQVTSLKAEYRGIQVSHHSSSSSSRLIYVAVFFKYIIISGR